MPVTIPEQQKEFYAAPEVCAMAGISYRNLDYWIRCGYVDIDHPETMRGGSGMPRKFTLADVRRFGWLSRLVHAGLKLDVAAAAVRKMHDNEVTLAPGVRLIVDDIDG